MKNKIREKFKKENSVVVCDEILDLDLKSSPILFFF